MQHPATQQSEAIAHMSCSSAHLSQAAAPRSSQDQSLLLHGLWIPTPRITWCWEDTSDLSQSTCSVWAVGCVLGTPKMQEEPSLAAVWAERGSAIFPLQGCKTAALGGGTTSSSSIPCTPKQQQQEICISDTSTVTLDLAGFFPFSCKPEKCLRKRLKTNKKNPTKPSKSEHIFSVPRRGGFKKILRQNFFSYSGTCILQKKWWKTNTSEVKAAQP